MPLRCDMIYRVVGEAGVELWIVNAFVAHFSSIGFGSLDRNHASGTNFGLTAFSSI
jgi:hypothetical protein